MSMIRSLDKYWGGRWNLIAGIGSTRGFYFSIETSLYLLLLKNDKENIAKGIYEIAMIDPDVVEPLLIKSWKLRKDDEKKRKVILSYFIEHSCDNPTLFLRGTVLDYNSQINLYSYIIAGNSYGRYNYELIKKFKGRSIDRIQAERKKSTGLEKSEYNQPLSISEAESLVKMQMLPKNSANELEALFYGYRSLESPGNSVFWNSPSYVEKYINSLTKSEDSQGPEILSPINDKPIITFGRPDVINPTLYCIAYELAHTNSKKVLVKIVELNPFTPKVLKTFSCSTNESKREVEAAKIKNWLSRYTKFKFPTFFVMNETDTDLDGIPEAVLENLPMGKANLLITRECLHNQIQRTKEIYIREPQESDQSCLSPEEIKEYIAINTDKVIAEEGISALYETWRISNTFNSKPVALSLDELKDIIPL